VYSVIPHCRAKKKRYRDWEQIREIGRERERERERRRRVVGKFLLVLLLRSSFVGTCSYFSSWIFFIQTQFDLFDLFSLQGWEWFVGVGEAETLWVRVLRQGKKLIPFCSRFLGFRIRGFWCGRIISCFAYVWARFVVVVVVVHL